MSGPEILPALAALASAATWALGSHLFRRTLEDAPPGVRPPTAAAANLFKNALAFAVFAAIFVATSSAAPPHERWPALLASGFFGFALGDTLYFASLPRCGVQAASMLALVQVPIAAGLGWIVADERVTPLALAGAAAILAGVTIVLSEPSPRDARIASSASRRAGVVLALLAAVAQAIGIVVGHRALEGVDVLGGTLARISGGVAGAFVVAMLVGATARASSARVELADLVRPWRERASRRGLVVAAIFGSVLGLPLFHYALRGLPSGVAAVLVTTTPLFALPIGLFLGERHGPRAYVGALLGIAGVALVVAAST